jgi:5-methyltetrahydrofolate--homocysteine methyltransferase
MVGGAVLTPEYAARIGADYYAKDAKQAADIVRTCWDREAGVLDIRDAFGRDAAV